MTAYVLAIGIPVVLLAAGLTAIARHTYRDEDDIKFNWQGTVPAAPGLCSCGAPHAVSPDAPFPGDPAPLPAPVPDPPPSRPEYVTDALDGHDDPDGWLESRWRKIDGQMLAEQLRDSAS